MVKVTEAYLMGKEAALRGWPRDNPFHRVKSEVEWCTGYDSVKETKNASV